MTKMSNEEIARIARIKQVSEEVVRRIVADSVQLRRVMEKYPECQELGAIYYLIDKEKSYIE